MKIRHIRVFIFAYVLFLCLQHCIIAQTYPTTCDHTDEFKLDCKPPFEYYTGYDTDFHVDDCDVPSITPTGTLSHYRKDIKYTKDMSTPYQNKTALVEDPNGTTIFFNSSTYISHISFWWKGVGVNGSSPILTASNLRYPLFTIGNNVNVTNSSFTVHMYKGLPCIYGTYLDTAANRCAALYLNNDVTTEDTWKKYDITWVNGSYCFKMYLNGIPLFSSPPGINAVNKPYLFCTGEQYGSPAPYNNGGGGFMSQNMYYPINVLPNMTSPTNEWQLQDLYIYTDTMITKNGYPNSNYNETYMDLIMTKSFACGPRYGFGSGCKKMANYTSMKVTPSYQYQTMSSLAGLTTQEINGLRRYLLFSDYMFMNDNLHTEGFSRLASYFTKHSSSALDFIISFKFKRFSGGYFNGIIPGRPLILFRYPSSRNLIGIFSKSLDFYACITLYDQTTDTVSLFGVSNLCYKLSNNVLTMSVAGLPTTYTQIYMRIPFNDTQILTGMSYVSYNQFISTWSLSDFGFQSISDFYTTVDKSKVSVNGLYVSEMIKDLYWYRPIPINELTSVYANLPNPFVFDSQLNKYSHLVNLSYSGSKSVYPLTGQMLYDESTLYGYYHSAATCLGNCAVYTRLNSTSAFVSFGNTTKEPEKVCRTGFANIKVGCQTACMSGDSRNDGLCLTGVQCYCPFGYLQSDNATCGCNNEMEEYGSTCTKCTCDTATSICNSGYKNDGRCTCVNPATMYNYSYVDPITSNTVTKCQCNNINFSYGTLCNNTCQPYLAPAMCSSGVQGNGSLSCPEEKKQIELLVDGVSFCQCKELTKQHGMNCSDCVCDYPSICSGGITGTGACICPSYMSPISTSIGRLGCDCGPKQHGPFCANCNCTLGSMCNSGVNATGTCYCPNPGYRLNEQGNGCDCPPNYYGEITNNPDPNLNGLCKPCDTCPYGTSCNQGRAGNGSCLTLPGYKCTADCGTPFAQIQCEDPLAYNMDCTGRCPVCNPGSECMSGMMGNGVCRKLPGFFCVSNCFTPIGIFDCVDPDAYDATCSSSCQTSNCPHGTRCSNGYQGDGSCIVLPEFALVPGTEANPVYDCADPNRWSSTCTAFCPASCPIGSKCSNGTMGNGQCMTLPNFEFKGDGSVDCVEGYFGLSCMQSCPICPAGSYCPSGMTSPGTCIALPFYRQISSNYFDCNIDRHGPNCQQLCPTCLNPYSYCDSGVSGTGFCTCSAPTVETVIGDCDCPLGTSGPGCLLSCPNCDANSTCSSGLGGSNLCLCNGNLTRSSSTAPCDCVEGYYGNNCQLQCGACIGGSKCDSGINGTGACICPLNQHFVGSECQCDAGFWGANCQYRCPNCTMYDSKMFCSDGKNGTGSCFCKGTDNLVLYQKSIFTLPTCQCDSGWRGEDCTTPAPIECAPVFKYYYYPNQTYRCDCFEGMFNQTCNSMCPPCSAIDPNSECDFGMAGTGTCRCKANYIKNEQNRCVCPPNRHGVGCLQTCKSCTDPSGFGVCNDGETGDGSCICPHATMQAHFNSSGSFLGCQCRAGYHGLNCSSMCYENCPNRDANSVCNDGMMGDGRCKCSGHTYMVSMVAAIATCQCQPGFYGQLCNNTCRANYTMYDKDAYCVDGVLGNGTISCRSPYIIQTYFPLKCECPQNRSGINCDIVDQVCVDQNAVVNTGMNGDGKCYCNAHTITLSHNATSNVRCICPPNKFGGSCLGTCPPCSTYHPDMYCLEGLQGQGICVCNSTLFLTLNYSSISLTGNPSCECKFGYGGSPCVKLPPPPPCAMNERVKLLANGTYTCDCNNGLYGQECNGTCVSTGIVNSVCLDGKNGNGEYVCKPNTALIPPVTTQCTCDPNWYGPGCDKFCNVTECFLSDSRKSCNPENAKCECKFPLVPYQGGCECDMKMQGIEVYGESCTPCYNNYVGIGYPNPHVVCDSGAYGTGAISCSNPDLFDLQHNMDTNMYECVCKADNHWGRDCLPCPSCNVSDHRVTCDLNTGFCRCPSTHYINYNETTSLSYCVCPHGYTGESCDTKIITPLEPCLLGQIRVVNISDGSSYCQDERVIEVNNTVYIILNETDNLNSSLKNLPDAHENSDAIGLSSLSIGDQIAAIIGYTAGSIGFGAIITSFLCITSRKTTEKVAQKVVDKATERIVNNIESKYVQNRKQNTGDDIINKDGSRLERTPLINTNVSRPATEISSDMQDMY